MRSIKSTKILLFISCLLFIYILRSIVVPDPLTFILNFQVQTIFQGSQNHPTAIIIGTQKGGTRALIEFLRKHPMIKAPVKEQDFFCDDSQYDASDYTYSKHLKEMPLSVPPQITLEKSPNSFTKLNTPKRLYRYQQYLGKNLKLILVVIPPIKRSVSHYFHYVRSRRAKGLPIATYNLTQALITPGNSFIDGSKHGKHLSVWLEYFSMDQILIVNGTQLAKENPAKSLMSIEDFLELERFLTEEKFYFSPEKGFYCYNQVVAGCMTSDKGHTKRSQNLTELGEEILKTYFKSDLELFHHLTNFILPAI